MLICFKIMIYFSYDSSPPPRPSSTHTPLPFSHTRTLTYILTHVQRERFVRADNGVRRRRLLRPRTQLAISLRDGALLLPALRRCHRAPLAVQQSAPRGAPRIRRSTLRPGSTARAPLLQPTASYGHGQQVPGRR